jgi:membrane-anchored mycosin MYCP
MDVHVDPSDEIDTRYVVVDEPYVALVRGRLRELQPKVEVTEVVKNPTLRLARLTLDGVENYAKENARPDSSAKPIETVVDNLRDWFSKQSGGWVPAMEGHGRVYGVIGLPQPKIQAEAELAAATAEQWQHSLDPNAGRRVRVGVLDTGIYKHDELAGHVRTTTSNLLELTPDEPINPAAGHATFIAGLITAQVPAAKIITRRVLDDTGHAGVWETAETMVTFVDDNIDVLNLSLGCHTRDGAPCPLPLQRAVEALSHKTVIVAAAGNHGGMENGKLPTWPAALPGVIAVGATQDRYLDPNHEPELAPFTPQLPWVDCLAPGYALVSTFPEGFVEGRPRPFHGFANWSGTSFAAAMVTGAIARGIVAGEITAKGALRRLLETPNPVVVRYTWSPELAVCETTKS